LRRCKPILSPALTSELSLILVNEWSEAPPTKEQRRSAELSTEKASLGGYFDQRTKLASEYSPDIATRRASSACVSF